MDLVVAEQFDYSNLGLKKIVMFSTIPRNADQTPPILPHPEGLLF